jgi:hypothetical protein
MRGTWGTGDAATAHRSHAARRSTSLVDRAGDGCWRDFHDQAVAPAVLRVGQRLDGPGELRLTLIVHEPGGSLEPPLTDRGAHARLRLDVADPVGALAMLRDQVVVALALREPDLDFTRQAAAPAGGGEIQKAKRRRVEHGGKVYTG